MIDTSIGKAVQVDRVSRALTAAEILGITGDEQPLTDAMARGKAITVRRVGKKTAGRTLDGRTWDEFPQAVAS